MACIDLLGAFLQVISSIYLTIYFVLASSIMSGTVSTLLLWEAYCTNVSLSTCFTTTACTRSSSCISSTTSSSLTLPCYRSAFWDNRIWSASCLQLSSPTVWNQFGIILGISLHCTHCRWLIVTFSLDQSRLACSLGQLNSSFNRSSIQTPDAILCKMKYCCIVTNILRLFPHLSKDSIYRNFIQEKTNGYYRQEFNNVNNRSHQVFHPPCIPSWYQYIPCNEYRPLVKSKGSMPRPEIVSVSGTS